MQLSRTLGWAASFAVLGLAWARAVEARPPLPRDLPATKGVALEPGKP